MNNAKQIFWYTMLSFLPPISVSQNNLSKSFSGIKKNSDQNIFGCLDQKKIKCCAKLHR